MAEIEAIYRRSAPAFERVAIAIAGGEDHGLDAVGEAFSRAIAARRGFRGDGPLEAWLWRIVINEAKRIAARRVDPVDTHGRDRSVAEPFGFGDQSLIRARIAALPEQQRNALFLRYYADLDYAAIAEVLGVTPGTVGASLHAARQRLAHELRKVREWDRSTS